MAHNLWGTKTRVWNALWAYFDQRIVFDPWAYFDQWAFIDLITDGLSSDHMARDIPRLPAGKD